MNRSSIRTLALVGLSLAMFWIWGSASFLKALDPRAFSEQITLHKVSPAAWSPVLAYFFIMLEASLALALIAFWRPRLAFLGSSLLLLAFMGVTGVAWATGNTEGCGCMGRLAARSPKEVILEDSGFLAIAVVGFFLARGVPTPRLSKKLFPALLPLAALLPFAGPSLPFDDLVTTFRRGADLSNLAADDLRVRLDQGSVLLVLLADSCRACDEGLPRLEEIAAAPDAPSIAAVFAGTRSEAQAWRLAHVPPFSVGHNPPKILQQYYRKLPVAALLRDGIATTVWRNRIPSWNEVQAAIPSKPSAADSTGKESADADSLRSSG